MRFRPTASESLSSDRRVGEKRSRLTNDSPPEGRTPRPDGIPPRRKKKRQAAYGVPRVRLDQYRRPSAAAQTMPPKAFVLFALALAIVGVAVWSSGPGAFTVRVKSDADKVYEKEAARQGGLVSDAAPEDAEHRAAAESLFGPELWLAKDGEEIADEPEWRRVVETMATQDPRSVVDRLEYSLNNHYDEVLKDPARFRGRFMRMRGMVAKNFHAYKLARELAGRGDVFRGLISDPDPDVHDFVFFDVLDPPPRFHTMGTGMGADAVDVDGVFYRLVRYETRDGRWVTVPWLIARTVVPVEREESRTPLASLVAGLAGFLALGFFIVYLLRRDRPAKSVRGASPSGFREMFDRKLQREPRREAPPPPDRPAE
jgi:hypothetical protein